MIAVPLGCALQNQSVIKLFVGGVFNFLLVWVEQKAYIRPVFLLIVYHQISPPALFLRLIFTKCEKQHRLQLPKGCSSCSQ